MFRLVSFAALGVLIVGLLGCKSKTPPPAAPPPAPPPVFKAGELLKDYGGNALAADGKYKDKLIQVTGKFGTLQKAPLLGYAIQLMPEEAGDVNLTYVQCFLHESAHAEASKISAGQMIKVEGYCDGQFVGQVKLSKCTLVK